jgi:hypothetical protein
MVSGRQARRGGGKLGCVVSLALFVAALYYGDHIGQVYLRYYRLRDAMRMQAQLAPSLDDGVIGRRLAARADSLFNHKPPHFRIRRGGNPRRITIQTEYTESVDLPFFKHTFVFKPKIEEGL